VISCFNATIHSKSPLVQNIFGAYGRNSGLVTYLALTFIYLGALMLRTEKSFSRLIQGLLIAGAINLVYCSYVLIFGDFVNWQNPYGSILGLFGNPDFISAFFGIFATAIISLVVSPNQSIKLRLLGVSVAIITLYEIRKSHAVQGLVVTACGMTIVGFFWLRSKYSNKLSSYLYVLTASLLGVLAILGTLQKGPLDFLYKRSVSLRGTYWRTAIKMGTDHPLTGVGMDAYGDWYRRARPPIALIDTPGPATTSNAAHNVVLDFFAFGGWPLLLTYLGILVLTIFAILKVIRRDKKYNFTFTALTTSWACYQLQSIISINQIGLSIWGWVLSGALVAYEISTRPMANKTNQKVVTDNTGRKGGPVITAPLLAGVGMLLGALMAGSPIAADSKFKSAIDSRNVKNVEQSLTPRFYNFSDSYRLGMAVQTFYNSNLPSLALKYSRIAVKFNPDNFSTWQQLYLLPNSTMEEKKRALQNLRRLDPLNSDVTKQY
jgi:O-antigen ligase